MRSIITEELGVQVRWFRNRPGRVEEAGQLLGDGQATGVGPAEDPVAVPRHEVVAESSNAVGRSIQRAEQTPGAAQLAQDGQPGPGLDQEPLGRLAVVEHDDDRVQGGRVAAVAAEDPGGNSPWSGAKRKRPSRSRFRTICTKRLQRPQVPSIEEDRMESSGHGDPDLEERLGPDDRALVGEGVEGLDGQAPGAGLDVDPADGGRGQAIGRGEAVEEAPLGGVEGQLVADVAEDLAVEPLGLEAGLVLDRLAGPQGGGALAAGRASGRGGPARGGCPGSTRTSVRRTGPQVQIRTWPPSTIRTSACHGSRATRWWARTTNQSGWRARPKTWKARSATRDLPELTPMPKALLPRDLEAKDGVAGRRRGPVGMGGSTPRLTPNYRTPRRGRQHGARTFVRGRLDPPGGPP